MKLYLTSWIDDDPQGSYATHQAKYTGTQADAKTLEKSLKSQFMRDIKTRDEEVPTDKSGLISYLNHLTENT